MADTTVASNLSVEQWDDDFFVEYVRTNRFSKYMGTGENAIFQIVEDLGTKPGLAITVPFLSRLTGAGVSGNAVLEGNEETLGNYGHKVNIDTHRHGVVVTKHEQRKTPIDLRNAARTGLMTWAKEQLRDKIIDGLHAVATADGGFTKYADATEANKDTYLTTNTGRFLFGAVVSNHGTDHSAALANIDNTTDKLDADMVSLAKRRAKTASPHIRPFRTTDDEEWFVMFCNSLSFRDLKTDGTITQANREARQRGMNNPLFTDGDLIWDGVIIREVPEIAVLTSVGAGSIDVAPNFMCGAQALAVAWGQRPTTVDYETDAKFRKGVAVEQVYGVEKLFFNKYQNGVMTVYSSGVADS